MSESVLGRRRSAGGRPFHTVGATTVQVRLCMIVVRANGTESNPSPMSAESDYFDNQIQVDKGRLGKLAQLTSPHHGGDPVFYTLPDGEPVKDLHLFEHYYLLSISEVTTIVDFRPCHIGGLSSPNAAFR